TETRKNAESHCAIFNFEMTPAKQNNLFLLFPFLVHFTFGHCFLCRIDHAQLSQEPFPFFIHVESVKPGLRFVDLLFGPKDQSLATGMKECSRHGSCPDAQIVFELWIAAPSKFAIQGIPAEASGEKRRSEIVQICDPCIAPDYRITRSV